MDESKLDIVIVQPYLPHYSARFMECLSKRDLVDSLTVLSDPSSVGELHIDAVNSDVRVVGIPLIRRFGIVFRPGRFIALLRNKSDIVVLSGDPRDVLSIFSALSLRLLGRKVAFWGMFHRIGGPRVYSQLLYKAMAFVSHGCISYGEIGARNLVSIGVDPDKIWLGGTAIDEIYPMGIGDSISDMDIHNFKLENSLEGRKVILQVVRLSAIKKPLLLLDLAEELIGRGREDFIIVMIGGGELYHKVIDELSSRKLFDFIRVLPSEYREDRLGLWFKSSCVFTVPTCIGLSIHHAFSYGLPVITDDSLLDQASEFELLHDGFTGLSYKSGDIVDYADKVERLLDGRGEREDMSLNCKKIIADRYSMKRKVDNFISAFISLV